jgi:glycosyl hydrolase family 43
MEPTNLSRRSLLILIGGVGTGVAVAGAGSPRRPAHAAGPANGPTAAGTPLWVGAGAFRHVFDPSTPTRRRYLNDHTVLRGPDGLWHLFSIVGDRPAPGEAPDSARETSLAHATSPSLAGPWRTLPDALTVDPGYDGEQHLWAPHVVSWQNRFHLFYAAGGVDGAAINLATSTDLRSWRRHPAGPLFRGIVARDPMVVRIGDNWVMYYTELDPGTRQHVVAHRTSDDLLRWGPAGTAFRDPTTDATVSVTESPAVVERDGWYYLFLGPRNGYVGTDVFRSTDPFRFRLADLAGHVPGHAVEVVSDGGTDVATAAGWFQRGLHLAPLRWSTAPTPWQSPDNPAVMLDVHGRLNAFALANADHSILRCVQTDPQADIWTAWERFGGPAGAVPTLGRNADGRLEVFSLAPRGEALHHRAQRADGSWTDWAVFGGPAGAAPAVERAAGGRLEVFALGPGGANVAHRRQAGAGSTDWEAWDGGFAGPAGAPPVAGRNADGRIEVFLLAPGGATIEHRWQTRPDAGGTEWSAWQTFGTAAGGAPRTARDGTGRQSVVAIAPSGTAAFVRQQLVPSGPWQDWQWQFPWSESAPALAAGADGRLEAFACSPGGERLLHRWQTSPGGGWHPAVDFGEPGVVLSGTPSVTVDATGRIHVCAVTVDGQVRRCVQQVPSGGWSPWTELGNHPVAAVPAGSPT